MHHRFLGIDIARVPQLAAALTDARTKIADATTLVLQAEALCEITTGAVGPLDDVARDYAALVAAVGAAAGELAAFRLPPIRRTRRRAQPRTGGSGSGAETATAASGDQVSTSRTRQHPQASAAFGGDRGPMSTSRTRPDHRVPAGDQPAFVDIGLDHVGAGVAAAAPELAAGLAERAEHQRWLAGIIDDTRVGGPPIRLDPRFTMTDTRYWFTWARHDLQIRRSALAARTRAAGFGGAASTTRMLGRASLVAGGALSAYTIYSDGKVAYTSSNGDTGVTTIAVLRATAGQAVEWTAVWAGGAACAPAGPITIGVCSTTTSAAVQGRGVEVVDDYFRALDGVADDMGIMNVADNRSLGQRVVDLFDLTPWS